MWKKIILGILGLLLLVGGAGFVYMQGLSDLRTDYVKAHGNEPKAQQKGRQLLEKSLATIGGHKQWKSFRKGYVQVAFDDLWFGFLPQKLFMPLEFSGQQMQMVMRPDQENARMTFLDGKRKGTSWGVQQWVTYTTDTTGKITWKPNETIKFYVPTCQYFFFMPFYLMDAQHIVYAGEKQLHGKTYDLVYATWGKLEPQKGIDQYLIWIERKGQRIEFIQFTVRDKLNRITATVNLTDYRKVGALMLPFSQKILNTIHNTKDIGHHIRIKRMTLLTGDLSKQLIPDPRRKAPK